MGTNIESHDTDKEIEFLDCILTNNNTPRSPRNHAGKVKALAGYIKAKRIDWHGLDRDRCIGHARGLLDGLR